MEIKIPEKDLRDINAIFGNTGSADALIKKSTGKIISAKKEALYKKYRNFIEDFDKLSLENQKAIIQIVTQIAH